MKLSKNEIEKILDLVSDTLEYSGKEDECSDVNDTHVFTGTATLYDIDYSVTYYFDRSEIDALGEYPDFGNLNWDCYTILDDEYEVVANTRF